MMSKPSGTDNSAPTVSKQHWMDNCATETLLSLSGWNQVI